MFVCVENLERKTPLLCMQTSFSRNVCWNQSFLTMLFNHRHCVKPRNNSNKQATILLPALSLSLPSSSFIIPSIVALWLHISLVKNCKFSPKLFRYNNESSMASKSFFAAAAAPFGYCGCFASNGTVAIGFILRIIGIFPGLNISMTMSIDLPRTRNGK